MARNLVVTVLCLITLTAGCTAELPIEQETPGGQRESGDGGGSDGGGSGGRDAAGARDDLTGLRVAREGSGAGYDRDEFGQRWKDIDRNGCDQRNDVLARDLDEPEKRGRCVVIGGRLDDPYTGRDITFVKADAAEVQIDHLYPLALAWRMGAEEWTEGKREEFANDRDNLLAVWARPNQQKSDSGPAEWQPRKSYQCTYSVKFIEVATEYDLSITRADRAALGDMLDTC